MAHARDLSAGDPRPNVILYVIDTLRADHLGTYGYSRPTSPHIDQLAVSGTAFDPAFSQDSRTLGSVVSLLTSLHPISHGVKSYGHKIGPEVITLAQALKDAGYQTGSFITNVNAGKLPGLDRGFDHFHDAIKTYKDRDAVRSLPERAVFDWLDRVGHSPFFAYIHTAEPHHPYIPPPPFDEMFEETYAGQTTGYYGETNGFELARDPVDVDHVRALYDGEIRFADAALQRLLDELEARELRARTIVILTADHGEELRDHGGWTHGHTLYNELIHVPLIFSGPGVPVGQRITVPVQLLDLAPTILDFAGVAIPSSFEGDSLRGLIQGGDREPFSQRAVFATTTMSPVQISLIEGSSKVIAQMDGRIELFDLSSDPKERVDLADRKPRELARFRNLIDEWWRSHVAKAARPDVPLTSEDEERLRALGYIE